MPLDQLSKHICHSPNHACILNASIAPASVEKRWPLILFFTYGNKKKSFGAKSGLYGGWLIKSISWEHKNAVVWAVVWELALSWWRVFRFRRLVFLISWQTTGKQVVVYNSELTGLRCSSGTIAICFQRLLFFISCKTTGKQVVVYHSKLSVLCCPSGTIAASSVFPKKRRSFAWKLFVR